MCHGVVVLIAKNPSAVPLLDTLKVLHIWYTTITMHGWYLLEFNYLGLVIGVLKSELISAQLVSAEVITRNCASLRRQQEN